MKKERKKTRQEHEAKKLLENIKFESAEDYHNCWKIVEGLLYGTSGVFAADGEFMEFNNDFDRVAMPLMKHLATTKTPHHICIVSANSAQIYKGTEVISTDKFIVD